MLYPRGNGTTAAPVRFIEGINRNDATLVAPKSISKTWLLSGGFAAAVICAFGYLGVSGPVRNQSEYAVDSLRHGHSLVSNVRMGMLADERA